jgi:hypothetical protein
VVETQEAGRRVCGFDIHAVVEDVAVIGNGVALVDAANQSKG